MSELVRVERNDAAGIVRLVLNRPDVLNALDVPLAEAFRDAVEDVARAGGVRAVIIAAEGRAFVAGGDVAAFGADFTRSAEMVNALLDALHPALLHLRAIDAPVIAAVKGVAAGAGLSLVLNADLVIAEEGTRFVVAYDKVGSSPDCGGTWFLPRKVGRAKAAELMFLGEALDERLGIRHGGTEAQRKELAGHALESAAQFVEAITYRRDDVPPAVAQRYDDVRGALAVPGELALAPTRDFAAPILGSVGPVTAEMVEESPETYRPGDVAGTSGLQARYDDRLRGTPGASVDVLPAEGTDTEPREVFRAEPTPGEPLRTSLDVDLQSAAEAVLAEVGPASALVALDPGTGAILAAANGPGAGGTNLATYGQAAPGSTFKTVSSLALLRAGLTPDSAVDCPATTTVDGREFGNYSDYPASAVGRITLRQAVAQSCNTAFITERGKLRGTDLFDAAASLGLGLDQDLGLPAYFGQVPQPETETESAAELIGQGRVLASPMVMATVVASVQSGRTVVPWLLRDYRPDPPEGAAPLTGGEATALRSMLRAVVTDGSGRGLLDVPGPALIAKTGTAEFEKEGRVLTHAWMVAAGSDLAVAVYVDEGASGSRTAGPLLEAFLRAARG